ncbi:MAG: PKD domain-containing protein, partial [Flavobacteriaceae bacterium]
WDITGYALGATVGAGQLPQGVNSSYTEIPQITEITFAGNPANFDNTDIYRITVNGVINSFTVNSVAVSSTFASILQQFETLIDSNVPQVDASYAANTLTIQSNTGDAVSVAVSRVNTTGDGGDPTLNAPNVTQVNRKFIRIFGAPTDPAAIYPYTITTFGPSCDPATANGTIRVVDTPTISVAPGSDANPSQLCNQSPMTDIDFNVSTFATYAVTWTGALGSPAGISLVRTTSSTISLISDPVINIPGAIPAGGVSYTYQIISTVNDNGCSSVATFTGIVNIINGTATLDLNDASSLTDDRVNANGGPFNPSIAPDYVLIEACQGSLIDDSLFDASVDITNVTIAAGGNLPSGLFGDFTPGGGGAVGQFRIYGTPDTATTEDIVLQAITDACVPAADIRVRIVVFPNSTITLDGGSNDNQTVCNNTALTNISYTLVGALDATIAGLPDGLVGNTQAPNKFIISGTPSVNISETTSYTYTITTTSNPGGPLVGACAETTITGVVTVRPDESLTVTSGAIAQQVCFGENITPIVISVVGENTFGSVANPATLPAGMNFTFVEDADNMGGIVTISGSPSAAIAGNNPFTYSFVTTTGGVNTSACADATQQIDITVVPPSSLAFSGPDSAIVNQTVCAGTLINEIEFTMGGGSSNVNVTFDAGLGFSRAANARINDPSDSPDNVVIFGTAPNALVQTTYNYEITTVNQCNPGTNEISVAGTITVIPEETITHRGASGATTQDVCVNQNVTPMIFDITGQNTHAKFVDASLVPSGISLDFAPDQATGNGGVATILGSPDITNAAGDYTFQITTGVSGAVSNTSQCADQTQSITITVKPLPTMVFSGADPAAMNQSVCQETAITPIQFTLGGGANDVTFSSSPAGLGFTRAANVSVDGNSVQIFGNAPVVGAETTFTYSISTVNPNSCTPSVTLGGSITVFPPVQYNNWAGNHTINNPLCSDDGGSIVVNAAAVTGGFVAVKQQSTVELNNSFAVGNIITINVGPQPFAYTVQGVDNATGNLSNNPAIYDRAQSKSEIITEVVGLINDANSGSTLVTAIGNSPSVGVATLIAKTSGIGFTLSGTKQPGASPGTITIANPVPNQSLTYGYYWRQTNSIGTPVTTLDITDPNTYVDTGLTLNLSSVTGSEYYMLTTVSNNCQADAPFVTITAPDPLALTITTICDTEITANGSGGTGQLTYILYNSGGTEIGRSPATFGSHTFSDGDANNIPGGGTVNITPGFQYQIGIKDANNCSLNGNDSTVQINTPLALVIDQNKITVTPPGCAGNDGSIQLDTGGFTITGGSAGNTGDYSNLTFLWTRSGGGTFNTQDIFGLSPADYTLTVTDNLCNTLFITSNPITLIDTADFTVTNAVDNSSVANCSDGNLQVSVAGGSGNFSFAWTDQFGVNRGTTNRIENLDAGIYTLIVRDTTTNCEQTFTYTITGSSGPLQALNEIAVGQANFTTTDILCNGAANGAFTVEFTGGNPPYSYSLNGAAYVANGFTTSTSSVTSGGASATVVSFTTQILSLDGLEGGTYSVKIKDSGLCLDDSGNIVELNLGSVTINEPDPLKIELNASTTEPIDCSAGIQGSLGVNITGGTVSGTTPYSILWELFGPSGEVLYKRTTSGSASDPDDLTITGLDYAGDYTVTVTDGAGCSTTEVITLDDGSNEDPFTVGETPAVTQPGCNSEELGTIELNLSGGVQPYNIKWYKLSVAQDSAVSSTASSSTASSSTSSSTTIEFSDGGYVSMNKDGFYLIDNLQPGKYRAIVTDATGCKIFSRSGLIKNSSFNMINQRVYNREILDCETGLVEADFSFRLSGTSLAYNIYLDGNLIYGGTSGTSSGTSTSSSTFTNNIVKQGNNFIIRNLTEGRHVVEAQDAANTECSLDYAFDVETYVPITYEGETEFEFDVCESGFQFELDTSFIIGGNPIIDDNDNVIYNLRWTYTPSDPNEPGSSFVGRTNFVAGRGTYQLIISDGTCASDPIDFVFSGDIDVLSIDGLLVDASGNNVNVQGVSCELGAQDGRISIQITGGQEPYNISWEIFDATSPVITPVSSTLSSTSSQINSPWKPLNGSYPGLGNFDGFTTLNELPAGLFRYTVRSGSTCPNPVDTPFNYLRDVISVDDDNTLVITDGPYVDPKLCEGLPGLLILDAVNNSDSSSDLNFFYIDTKGTEDIGDDGVPVALNGNTTKLDEDTYQILIDTPFEYGKLVITTDEGCGVESEFNLALGDPYFSYTSPSFEQVNEIPAREEVTFIDESEGEFSKLEWNFGDNSEIEVINISGTVSGVTQVTHAYGNSGTYYPTLTIYNEIGCYESVTNPITIGRGYSIYTPNVFTPNNDCLNDYFRPLFTGFESLTFNVYDSRGNLIYTEQAQDGSINRSECPNQIDSRGNGKAILGWNGKRADNSTLDAFSPYYVYSISGVPLNRVTDDQIIERSGIFTILK